MAPSTRKVLDALAAAGFEGRVVGGTVRNTLMGLPVSDIDIATPARPEAVVTACASAGLVTVPTGLEHGTVTVIADRTPIEVTTLRRDVATDGRRATVAFTDDWLADAQRRDFTMNALYCDAAGHVHDPVGGYPDLLARRVRFIGDPDARIAEDYLRILRFFRFHAAFAVGLPDPAAMAACARGIGGLARLSAERIRSEVVKLMLAPGVAAAIRAMLDVGLLPTILGAVPRPDVLEAVIAAEAPLGLAPDAMLRLSALALSVDDDRARLAARLRLSTAERKALLVIDDGLAERLGPIDPRRARQLVYREGAEAAQRQAAGLMALWPGRESEARLLVETARNWSRPKLAVSGADLVAEGFAPGPRIGLVLAEVERWWVDADFPDAAATRAALARIAAAADPRQ